MTEQSYSSIPAVDQPPQRHGPIKSALSATEERTTKARVSMMAHGQFFSAYELEKFVRRAR